MGKRGNDFLHGRKFCDLKEKEGKGEEGKERKGKAKKERKGRERRGREGKERKPPKSFLHGLSF